MAAERFARACRLVRCRFVCMPSPRIKGFRVMPGGLARVSSDAAADVVSSQRGGGSKDIWVISRRERR